MEDFWASLGSDLLELSLKHMHAHRYMFWGECVHARWEHKCKMGVQINVSIACVHLSPWGGGSMFTLKVGGQSKYLLSQLSPG